MSCAPRTPVGGLLGALAAALLAACGPEVASVPLRVTHGAEENPFLDASELELSFLRAGVVERRRRFPVDTPSLDLGVLAFGSDLQVELAVFAGEFEIARGSSFPFEVEPSAPPPLVDIHVGLFGRFTTAVAEPLDGAVVGSSPGPSGALVATTGGTLYRYDAHAPSDGRPQLTRLADYAELRGASWLALDGGGLLALGGDRGRARRYDAAGEEAAEVFDGRLDDQRYGAVSLLVDGAALVLGGSPLEFGGMTAGASRVLLRADGSLAVETLPDLPCATRDSASSLVPIPSVSAATTDRVVLVCGDALRESRLLSLDPTGLSLRAEVALPGDLREAAVMPLGVGLLLVAGGRGPEGLATDAVHVVAIADSSISEIGGASRPLFAARVGAAASALSPGRVLLVGGRDDAGQPLSSAEIVAFPGRVALTRDAPMPMAAPTLVELADGVVLAAAATGLAQYVPAR